MSKFAFNDIFKEIVDTYYIDSTALGTMIDRDSSRIRHYKVDSKPGKAILDKLIQSICAIIDEKNDAHINNLLMERLNQYLHDRDLLTEEIRSKLSEIKNIDTYVAFLLRKSRETTTETVKANNISIGMQMNPLIDHSLSTKVNQAHQYFENNLYQEAIGIYEELTKDATLSEQPQQALIVYSDLGLIYRNSALSQYNEELLQKAIHYLDIASELSEQLNDLLNYALVNKYLGTIYTFLFNFEDSENNLKKATNYYNNSLSALVKINNLDEHSKVLINYGILYLYYSNIRNTRNFLKNAISYFSKAMDYFESHSNHYFHALACLNCSGAYSFLAEICNTEANAALATKMTQNALKVFTIEDYPILYAQCISNLGYIHYILAKCFDTVTNCNKAINYIQHALSIVTEEVDVNSYAIAHLNLSVIYTLLSNHVDKQDNIAKAMDSLNRCKKHYQQESYSFNNVRTSFNQAEVLIELSEANYNEELLSESEGMLENLLDFCTKMNLNYFRANGEYNLARLNFDYYKERGEERYLEKSFFYTNKALETLNINDYPLFYAQIMHLVAKIHDYTKDYESSKNAYESILRIFTREKYPDKYSDIINEYNQLIHAKG
ncbi:MAG TPA: hypothetical protein VN258_04560 [Mobilitalea sp.]|nr:hypothetical protein [Mobilitalea sp.]